MGVPLVKGRLFNSGDRLGTRKVVILSRAAAEKFWPGQDPIGRPIGIGQGGFEDSAYVVGVIGDVRFGAVDTPPEPEAYLSYYQSPRGRMMIFVRSAAGDPVALTGSVRAALKELAPEYPVYDVRAMRERVADALAYARFSTVLLGLFAAVALGLATMGVYGVIAFAVSQRTQEIGIRMALGATRRNVVGLIIGQGVGIGLSGALIGLVAALATTRVLRALLYDTAPSDPATFLVIVTLLIGAVVLASWVPARRAATIPPTEALRTS
jgi:ABC-type antimicrobial peptide transport system permease subunit